MLQDGGPAADFPAEPITLVAIATPPVAGAIGILRLSGPSALRMALTASPGVPIHPVPRHAYFTDLCDRQGEPLDQGLFIYFQAPQSYTGEDVVELQTHGSPRLLQMLQRELLRDSGVRLAEPGEFTRRAFLNGRIDLARAEAVADLVSAESEAAVKAAARQVRGALSTRVKSLRVPLVEILAEVEGLLGFPEEAAEVDADLRPRLGPLLSSARALLAEADRGTLLGRGATVVLFGPTNAGKSTLFNRLAGDARALVDPEPGTTRDALTVRLEVEGLPLVLVDTAGLTHRPGRVEAKGIEHTRQWLEKADLAVLLVPPGATRANVDSWTREAGDASLLCVRGKSDQLAGGTEDLRFDLAVSGLTGAGTEELERAVLSRLWGAGSPQAADLTSERHADALRRAAESLERAWAALQSSNLEVVGGELSLAVEALGEITGENAPSELLDAIFRRFCIGK